MSAAVQDAALGRLLLELSAAFEVRLTDDPADVVRARLFEVISEEEAAAIIVPRLREALGPGLAAVSELGAFLGEDALRRLAGYDRVRPVLRAAIFEISELFEKRGGAR